MKILIDNGHGLDTPGKRSPDGKLLEAIYTRQLAQRIVADLQDRGYDAELLVPEEDDISLAERVRRVNTACFLLDKQNVILISIHVNAAGNGTQWMNATGWSCYTCKGQTESDRLATCLYQSATKYFPGRRIRTDFSDGYSLYGSEYMKASNRHTWGIYLTGAGVACMLITIAAHISYSEMNDFSSQHGMNGAGSDTGIAVGYIGSTACLVAGIPLWVKGSKGLRKIADDYNRTYVNPEGKGPASNLSLGTTRSGIGLAFNF